MDKQKVKSVFDQVYASRGGYYDYDAEGMGRYYDNLLTHLRNVLYFPNLILVPKPVVHIGFILNPTLGAVVTKFEGEYYIGVHVGTEIILMNLFGRMLSSPSILSQFGDASLETGAKQLFNPHTSSMDQLFIQSDSTEDVAMEEASPVGTERKSLVRLLTIIALSYLILHENAHIVNGHLDYLMKSQDLVCFDESDDFIQTGETLLESQVLEYDADCYASVKITELMGQFLKEPQHFMINPKLFVQEHKQMLYLMGFACYSMFRLFGASNKPINQLLMRSHPPFEFRSKCLINTASSILYEREKRGGYTEGFSLECSRLLGDSVIESEKAFIIIAEEGEGVKGSHLHVTIEWISRILDTVNAGWVSVRPKLLPFAYNMLVPADGSYYRQVVDNTKKA